MIRVYQIVDLNYNFIGAFCCDDNEAVKKCMDVISRRNEIRAEIGFEPYANGICFSNYEPGEKKIKFEWRIQKNVNYNLQP